MLASALRYSHQLIAEVVDEHDTVVDATMGNGHDTLFLAQHVPNGVVHSFDIQEQALEQTAVLLSKYSLTAEVALHHDGHENINTYIPHDTSVKAALFNLGYLPKSDKQIITKAQTTLTALNELVSRLALGGRIVIVAYYGHQDGKEELQAVTDFCQRLDQHQYQVLHYQFINQLNHPPILFCIERRN
ncbi:MULTISPECIES: tRNA (mnm(5)s(2)U34)-methyltransferase [Enterococcus]|uniref:rRNA methylase n=1 Tax=Enterococcus sulfureus ATCC 49903 TaxID=1140003 RepID=S0L5T6_9ENTE|nr:class I SAM-dependent methyltransferase [Enterococcus sulfureus]EOT48775.1 hypothetical protein OMY_00731 [Enterococcus sulfureus ATCC 49903]EOT87667.1 hypothetical protein I573_00724 [Enterococcus sulfureus ATCC 49903]